MGLLGFIVLVLFMVLGAGFIGMLVQVMFDQMDEDLGYAKKRNSAARRVENMDKCRAANGVNMPYIPGDPTLNSSSDAWANYFTVVNGAHD